MSGVFSEDLDSLLEVREFLDSNDDNEAMRELRNRSKDYEIQDVELKVSQGVPGATVSRNGTDFSVHGLVHGLDFGEGILKRTLNKLVYLPLLRDRPSKYEMSEDVKTQFSDAINKWVEDGDEVFVEQRLLDRFPGCRDNEGVHEMDDTSYGNLLAHEEGMSTMMEESYGELPTIYDRVKYYVRGGSLSFEPENTDLKGIKNLEELEEKHLDELEEHIPVRFQEEYLSQNDMSEFITGLKRSERMAEYAVSEVSPETDEAHIVCGIGHYADLMEYLQKVEERDYLEKFHDSDQSFRDMEFNDLVLYPQTYWLSQTFSVTMAISGSLHLVTGIAAGDAFSSVSGLSLIGGSYILSENIGDGIDYLKNYGRE